MFGAKDPKHEKIRKTFRSCMARLRRSCMGRKMARKTFRSCMALLLRNCIQDFVQEVPVAQTFKRASSTSPWLLYQVSSEVFSKSSCVMSSLLLLFLLLQGPKSCNFNLSQLQNLSKDDFPMALLPDPTTAASERSSVKRRLTGCRA